MAVMFIRIFNQMLCRAAYHFKGLKFNRDFCIELFNLFFKFLALSRRTVRRQEQL